MLFKVGNEICIWHFHLEVADRSTQTSLNEKEIYYSLQLTSFRHRLIRGSNEVHLLPTSPSSVLRWCILRQAFFSRAKSTVAALNMINFKSVRKQ